MWPLKRWKVLVLALLLVFVSSLTTSGYDKDKEVKAGAREDLYNQLELFADAISILRSDYVDNVDSKKLIYGAMKGMLASLDDFSQFLEPDEYNELKQETKGEFGGIGIEISVKDGVLTVVAPISGTPADEAGIKAGDKIIKIDGKVTKNMGLDEAVKIMRGRPGAAITLTVWREKDRKVIDIQLKRAVIKIESIRKAVIAEAGIGYIKLVEFQERTPEDLEKALKKLEGEGIAALILDLRNNPGGLLEGAVGVSERFLQKDKVIVSIRARDPANNATIKSSGKFTHPDYPMIVIVNEGSASASEIVAGAVQDNKRCVILGTKTFGKASVQTVIPLKDGSAIRFTTATYHTPSGRLIKNEGITPDVVLEKEEGKAPEAGEEKLASDNQIDMAVKMLKAMRVYKAPEK